MRFRFAARVAERARVLLSQSKKSLPGWQAFSFSILSSEYHAEGVKTANFLCGFWCVSGLESGFVTSVFGIGD
jgi:hypothetical protein